ncbi:MAG TPA: WD40 repeat domain-containing protein [Solirubrobacteraceae bacterium]
MSAQRPSRDASDRGRPVDDAPLRDRPSRAASLGQLLRDAPLPAAEEAELRAWAVVADGYASRPPAPRLRRRGRVIALALAALLAAAAVAVAAEPPRWVRHVLGGVGPPPVRVSLGSLPAGRLLVSSARGTWIVRGDGTRVRLGPWTAATWSPRGLYVAAWRGRELSAVAPDGRVAWTLAAPAAVRDVRWSPDGYRIAYRRADGLAVVAGDGTGPHVLATPVAAVAPAWRPGDPHTLAWVSPRGQVEVRDVDSGRVAWRSAAAVAGVRELRWSADGRRLLARGPRRLVVLDVRRNRVWRVRLPTRASVEAAAWAPRGHRLAVAVQTRPTSSLYVTASARLPRRPAFSTTGTLGSLAWSPDGSRLLVRWREPDQWLLVPPSPSSARITAIPGVSRRFGGPPSVQGWCCS